MPDIGRVGPPDLPAAALQWQLIEGNKDDMLPAEPKAPASSPAARRRVSHVRQVQPSLHLGRNRCLQPTPDGAGSKRRCVIPASAFYEWTGEKGAKIPHRISAADGGLLGFAGLWDRWTDTQTGEEVISCTIITRDADRWMSKLHNRMPAMLRPEDFQAWLDGSGGKELLMRPPPELQEWIVSTRINSNRAPDDDPTLADPAMFPEVKPPPQGDLF